MNKKIQLFLFLCFSFFLLFFLTFHPVFAVSALEGISTLREISLEKNETLTLPVTAVPSSAHISSVSFRSVNPSIVKVTAQGQLTALSQGRANLWITASDSQNPPNIFKKRIRISFMIPGFPFTVLLLQMLPPASSTGDWPTQLRKIRFLLSGLPEKKGHVM